MEALMSSILAMQGVRIAIFVVLGILAVLYVLSIVWVARDAYLRDTNWVVWTIVALIPLIGVIAYCLLRPSLYQIDRDEQELEIAMKQRELAKYGECARCGYPVEADYVICPNCLSRLKNLCPTCGRALEPSWRVWPYCATNVGGSQAVAQAPAAQRQSAASYQDAAYADFSDIDEANF